MLGVRTCLSAEAVTCAHVAPSLGPSAHFPGPGPALTHGLLPEGHPSSCWLHLAAEAWEGGGTVATPPAMCQAVIFPGPTTAGTLQTMPLFTETSKWEAII